MGIRGKCFQLGILGEHPARDRVFQAEHIADRAQFLNPSPGIGWCFPALVRVEDNLHARRCFALFRGTIRLHHLPGRI